MNEVRLSPAQLRLVRFCNIECHLQGAGELSVSDMLNAWTYAQDKAGTLPVVEDVVELGRLVDPVFNARGLRQVGVRVGLDIKPDWQGVPRLLDNLMDFAGTISAQEWFKAFEEIHPFRDGNGRVGVILYNWLGGTLDEPVWPVDPFGDPRRGPGFGAPGEMEEEENDDDGDLSQLRT